MATRRDRGRPFKTTSAEDWRAVSLVVDQGLTYQAASKILGVVPGTVRAMIIRTGTEPPGNRAKLDPALAAQVIHAVMVEGKPYTQVGKEFGVKWETVRRYVRAAGGLSPIASKVRNHQELLREGERLIDSGMRLQDAAIKIGVHSTTLSTWRRQAGLPRLRPPGRPTDPYIILMRDILQKSGPMSANTLYSRIADAITPGAALRAAETNRVRQVKEHDQPRQRVRSTEELVELGKREIFRERLYRDKRRIERFEKNGELWVELAPPERKIKSEDRQGDIG